jgi:hypothetical protein
LAPGGGRAAKPRGRPVGWSGLHRHSPLTQACPHVDAWQPRLGPNRLKPWPIGQGVGPASGRTASNPGRSAKELGRPRAEPPQALAGRSRSWASRPAPGPTRPGVWPTWSTCQIYPCGDDNFDIWSTSLCHLLKCSNLVPKFLKSNKH